MQTTSNACASIALLNIMMNIKGLDLGPILESLKDFTWTLTPALRGYSVCNHDFIRQVHNSFSRYVNVMKLAVIAQRMLTAHAERWI
jgi:ubiquitin carboxyl-terminal hydrolase L5